MQELRPAGLRDVRCGGGRRGAGMLAVQDKSEALAGRYWMDVALANMSCCG